MNPFEQEHFRESLRRAFMEAIKKVGIDAFKRISWFPSSEKPSK